MPKHVQHTTKSKERARISPWSRATFRFRTQTRRQQRGIATDESDPERKFAWPRFASGLLRLFGCPSDVNTSNRIETPVFLRFQNRRVLAIGR
jgi:hypothetical protein